MRLFRGFGMPKVYRERLEANHCAELISAEPLRNVMVLSEALDRAVHGEKIKQEKSS
jgi:hypothetical protein